MHSIKIVYMTLVKDVRAGFIQGGYYNGILEMGREIRLNSQCDKER